MRGSTVRLGLAALTAGVLTLPGMAQADVPAKPTFSKDIAPIF